MTEVKHTPTPWKVSSKRNRTITANGGRVAIASKTPMGGNCHNKPLAVANAAHIVKCVNLHDELVEALERARQYMKDEFNNVDDTGEEFSIVEHMEAVLKKAGAL